MPVNKLKELLDREKVKYTVISHSQAFTAQEIAASAHIPGKELAKTVIVKIDGKTAMAVLPASHRIDFALLKEATGASEVKLATEGEFKDMFPGCEVGAMPPFGNLYGLKVYVDELLREDQQIAFNAGSHAELIQMDYAQFERLVQPVVASLSAQRVSPA